MAPQHSMDEKRRERERAARIQQVYDSFKNVTRDNGVSWSQAWVLDGDDSEENLRRAGQDDKDQSWTELVDDPHWRPDSGVGGFSFLDPIGFRYYLAPAMVRSLRSGDDEGIQFHLTVPARKNKTRERILHKLSALNREQSLCVRAFLEFMLDSSEEIWKTGWRDCLNSYWAEFQ